MRRLAVLFVALSLVVGCGPRGVGSTSIKSTSSTHRAVETADTGCPTGTKPMLSRCLTYDERHQLAHYLTVLAVARYVAAIETAAVGACGGDLPSCCTLEIESHGNPYAVEPGHQGAPSGDPGDPGRHASGKWQFMPDTWDRYGGYPWAAAAPATVQNAKAREVYAGGAGWSHWKGDGCYPGG